MLVIRDSTQSSRPEQNRSLATSITALPSIPGEAKARPRLKFTLPLPAPLCSKHPPCPHPASSPSNAAFPSTHSITSASSRFLLTALTAFACDKPDLTLQPWPTTPKSLRLAMIVNIPPRSSSQQPLTIADDRSYERRDRSASPRGGRDEPARSRSPNGHDRS